MTREEIKSRATRYGVKYVELDGSLANLAEGDMAYLLDRNEELQRRVVRLENGILSALEYWNRCEELGAMSDALYEIENRLNAAMDAKEQDVAPKLPELVPVYPGPDLKRGDVVYTPNGTRAEVYNISEDAGTFTSQGQFCASVLRREKKDHDDD